MDKYFSSYWPQLGLGRDDVPQRWPGRTSLGAELQHDRAGPAPLAASTTASASCTARSRATCGTSSGPTDGRRGADRLDHQRRAYRDLAGPATAHASIPRYLGADWYDHLDDPAPVGKLRDDARRASCGQIHTPAEARSDRALRASATRSGGAWARSTAPDGGQILDPDALTLGFARRFATYKRATLLFSDPDRLKALLDMRRARPVQIIFAGKAHPADAAGQAVHPAGLLGVTHDPRFEGEDRLPRRLRHGRGALPGAAACDVWLNNPRRPLRGQRHQRQEGRPQRRCPTEHPRRLVGRGLQRQERLGHRRAPRVSEPRRAQDGNDAQSLYTLLEAEVVPRFYDRGADGIPHGWVQTMKEAIMTWPPPSACAGCSTSTSSSSTSRPCTTTTRSSRQ